MVTALTEYTTGIGVVSYNGYTLTPARSYSFDIQLVTDDSGRAKVVHRYTLKGRWWVTSDTEDLSSAAMSDLRQKLSEPGQKLTLTDIGFGDITVGGNAATKDPWFGPHPKVGHAEPVGGMIAWLVDWSVEFNLLDCESLAVPGHGSLVALNRRVSISIDAKGYTTINETGYWQISLNRKDGGSAIETTADAKRDLFKPAVPLGFKRESQNYSLNEAGNRMDWSITDVELHGPEYPTGIVDASVSYDVSSNERSFSKWHATLSGSLEVKKGFPLGWAATKFLAIVAMKKKSLQVAVGGTDSVVLAERFSFGMEDIFSRRSRFSITWLVAGQLNDFIKKSGVWERVEEAGAGTAGSMWRASMLDVWGPRGLAQVAVPPDTIIDPCGNETLKIPDLAAVNKHNDYGYFDAPFFAVGNIPPEQSWLEYENHIRYVREQNAAYHIPAVQVDPPKNITSSLSAAAGFQVFAVPSDTGVKVASPQSIPSNSAATLQYQGAPSDMLIMYGKAMRVKHQPAVPLVAKVLGAEPVMIKSAVEPAWIIGRVGTDNTPVFVTRWAFLFKVPDNFDVNQIAGGAPNLAAPAKPGQI